MKGVFQISFKPSYYHIIGYTGDLGEENAITTAEIFLVVKTCKAADSDETDLKCSKSRIEQFFG